MQTEAQKAMRHLENADRLRKIANELRGTNHEAAEKLVEVAEDYERLALKLTATKLR